MKLYSISFALLLFASLARAQVSPKTGISFGAEGGINRFSLDLSQNDLQAGNVHGKLGLFINMNLHNKFYLRLGLYYNGKGGYLPVYHQYYTIKTVATIDYLEIPLSVFLLAGRKNRLYLGPGIYFARAFNGQEFSHISKMGNLVFDDDKAQYPPYGYGYPRFHRNDYGLQFSVGQTLPFGLFIQVQASLGLRNIVANSYGDVSTLYNAGYMVTLGWALRDRLHKKNTSAQAFFERHW